MLMRLKQFQCFISVLFHHVRRTLVYGITKTTISPVGVQLRKMQSRKSQQTMEDGFGAWSKSLSAYHATADEPVYIPLIRFSHFRCYRKRKTVSRTVFSFHIQPGMRNTVRRIVFRISR